MKHCLNCANYIPKNHKWKCKSMTAPMAEYKCHTTAEKATRAEIDISNYGIRHAIRGAK